MGTKRKGDIKKGEEIILLLQEVSLDNPFSVKWAERDCEPHNSHNRGDPVVMCLMAAEIEIKEEKRLEKVALTIPVKCRCIH